MKLIGIIGGTGPESTIDYYRMFVSEFQKRKPDGTFPRLLINSIDLTKLLTLAAKADLAELIAYLSEEITRLAAAGAELGLLAANTPHVVFDELANAAPIPLLSIVEVACNEARRRGYKRVGLFGTRVTMQTGFYKKVFNAHHIELVIPELENQSFIHNAYLQELVKGVFKTETRTAFEAIVTNLVSSHGIEALVLGGTEMPLLLRDAEGIHIPMLDTGRLHVERALDIALS